MPYLRAIRSDPQRAIQLRSEIFAFPIVLRVIVLVLIIDSLNFSKVTLAALVLALFSERRAFDQQRQKLENEHENDSGSDPRKQEESPVEC
jgi:hypothetical protein